MESFEDKENLTLYGVKIHLEEEELYLPNPSTIWCMPRCNQEYNLLVPLELKNFKECAEKKDKKEYLSMVQSAIDYIQQYVCILVTSSITQKNNGYNDKLEKSNLSELSKTTSFLETIIDKLSEE
ncbi:hypothetical protein HOE37_02225 [Candidatus Woesearchaeota archaeon]|nr:hypothetical protein [Candidatus Woesearchaeota archaeon]